MSFCPQNTSTGFPSVWFPQTQKVQGWNHHLSFNPNTFSDTRNLSPICSKPFSGSLELHRIKLLHSTKPCVTWLLAASSRTWPPLLVPFLLALSLSLLCYFFPCSSWNHVPLSIQWASIQLPRFSSRTAFSIIIQQDSGHQKRKAWILTSLSLHVGGPWNLSRGHSNFVTATCSLPGKTLTGCGSLWNFPVPPPIWDYLTSLT